jgi:DNA-binding CsgD family transcriptional regulator
MVFGSAKLRKLTSLVSFLERGVVSLGDLDEMLERLCGLYDGAAIVLTQTPDFVGPGRALRVPADWAAFHLRHRGQDPCPAFLAERSPGSSFCLDSDLPVGGKELALYSGFRGLGFGGGFVTRIHSPFSDELYLPLYREGRPKPISAEDRMLVRLLHPHLAGALAAQCALAHLSAAGEASSRPASSPAFASVSISYPSLRVEWTRRAKEVFRRRLGATGEVAGSRIERMILRAVRRFDRWEVGGRSQILVPGIRIELANVPPRAEERRRVVAMFIEDREPRHAEPTPAEELLSPRQREVAREAARGSTTKEIATKLGISVETARWHLKCVFDRLGVAHRAELARLIS